MWSISARMAATVSLSRISDSRHETEFCSAKVHHRGGRFGAFPAAGRFLQGAVIRGIHQKDGCRVFYKEAGKWTIPITYKAQRNPGF